MDKLVFWNKTGHADILANIFGKENVITSKDEFLKIIPKWKKFNSIIVLCEINWSYCDRTVKMQHFCGIELVKELRRAYNINLPVLFASFYELSKLLNAESEIVTSIAHNFCQLPVVPQIFVEKLKAEKKLSPIELKDIQLFSCNPKGIVSVKIHQIQEIVNKLNNKSAESIKSELEKCIEELHSVFKVNADIALNKFKLDFFTINKDNINAALRFIDEIGKDLIDKYTPSTTDQKASVVIRKPWKLLLLDDELNNESDIIKLLKEKGVDVICTSNVNDATKVLTDDNSIRGKISLILSDYRLNKKEGEVLIQQRKQGYTFLQEVGEKFQSKLISAVVYSGMPRQFLLETFKTFKIRAEIYSKIDFKLDDIGARNFLVNRIIELGDENYSALLALPLASDGWRDYLHDTYLLFRNQSDYETREKEICDFCSDWVEKFRVGKTPPSPMIKGDAFNPKKQDTEKVTLERFVAFYKTRRLAQFLNLFYGCRGSENPADIIPQMLSYPNKKMDTPELKRRFFSQTIGFKKEEFPFSATIEELCWFEFDLGIEVLDSYKRFRNKLNESENIIGGFILDINNLKKSLVNISFKYVDERRHVLLFDSKSCNPFLFDKMDLGLSLEWLNDQKESFTKVIMDDYLSLLNSIENIWK